MSEDQAGVPTDVAAAPGRKPARPRTRAPRSKAQADPATAETTAPPAGPAAAGPDPQAAPPPGQPHPRTEVSGARKAAAPKKAAAARRKSSATSGQAAAAKAAPGQAAAPERKAAGPDTHDVGAGDKIAGYRIEEQIGQGGMAVVYRARDEHLGRQVALKLLAPGLAADAAFRHRFIRESRSAASVDHPNIIPIYEAGDAGGSLFIAMRYVHGGDVRSLLEDGPLSAARTWSIITQVAAALDAAHQHGLIHRDVKPANMLLDARAPAGTDAPAPGDQAQHVYLSDFGISKQPLASSSITMTGQFVGTLDYIAPEQIDGVGVDGRTDLYSLGCAAYELLTGAPPFRKSKGLALVRAHLSEPPPSLSAQRPDLPAAADAVLAGAMAKAPDDRYATCMQFAANLGRALGLAPGQPELPVTPQHRGPRPEAGNLAGAWPATQMAAAGPGAAPAPVRPYVAWPAPGQPGAAAPPHAPAADAGAMAPGGPVAPGAFMAAGPMTPAGPVMPGGPSAPGGPAGPGGPWGPGGGWPPGPAAPAPPRPRSRGKIVAAVGAVAAAAAVAVAVVLVLHHGNDNKQLNAVPPPSTSSAPGPTPSPTPTPSSLQSVQANAVSSLLATGNGSATNLNNAVNDVASCGNVSADVSQIQQVENQRQNEYNSAQNTQTSSLPNGAALKSDLVNALYYSLQADKGYLAYANQMQSSNCQSGSQASALAADGKAVTYKDMFLSLWNPIAATYGLPAQTQGSI